MPEEQPVASTSRVPVADAAAPILIVEQADPFEDPAAVPAAIPERGEIIDERTQQRRPQTPILIPENPEWGLKEIIWPPEPWEGRPQYRVRIVTQNANGPCSFIAICNILLLRGSIRITPPDRRSASYEYLSSLLGDYLVNTALDVDIATVFSVLPTTQHGLDLNPLFTGISSFRPAGEGGQLKLFDLAGIKLVHGWLADPHSQEFAALSKTEDYDTSLDAIVAADTLNSRPDQGELSEADQELVLHSMLIRQWLDANPTQLTYYGLFALNDSPELKPNELACLFRGSHLSVLYKRLDPAAESTMLYSLVTDRVFLRESSVVWESLVDVDGQSSSFYDSFMAVSTPAGGDFAGQTAEQIARMYEQRQNDASMSSDFKLARQLQIEEDHHAYEQHQRRLAEAHRAQNGAYGPGYVQGDGGGQRILGSSERNPNKKEKKKDKGDCIIM